MEYSAQLNKFIVILRYEVPRSEYSFDNAVSTIIELNSIYNPTWIFADRGSGEYQIERLHIYGEQNPGSGLKEKLVGWQFKNKVEILDPITKSMDKKPMKPFMVNQLTIALEREKIVMSPYDTTMKKQMTDYVVERVSQNGDPVYSSENEHSIDALGLAYLAFVLKFSALTQQVKMPEFSSKVIVSDFNMFAQQANAALRFAETTGTFSKANLIKKIDTSEPRGERANYVKIPLSAPVRGSSSIGNWGSRKSFNSRSSW